MASNLSLQCETEACRGFKVDCPSTFCQISLSDTGKAVKEGEALTVYNVTNDEVRFEEQSCQFRDFPLLYLYNIMGGGGTNIDHFCDTCGPCEIGGGDCDDDSECKPPYTCLQGGGAS